MLLGVLRETERADLFAVFIGLLHRVVRLAELRLQDLHLLTQQIVLLRLIHTLLRLLLQLVLDMQDLQLMLQIAAELLQAAAGAGLLQKLLLDLRTQEDMLRDEIGHKRGIRAAEDRDDRVRRHMARRVDIIVKEIAAAANQRVDARR